MTEHRASIDELLRHEEEPAAGRPVRAGLGWAVKTIGYAAGLAAIGVFGLRLLDVAVPFPLAYTVALALLILRRVVRLVAAPPPAGATRRSPSPDGDGEYRWGSEDGLRSATARWDSRLDWSHLDAKRFARTVQPRLGELVDERLRQRHGFTRAEDPAAARALLGEPLWTFLAVPVGKPPTPRQLAVVVKAMEAL